MEELALGLGLGEEDEAGLAGELGNDPAEWTNLCVACASCSLCPCSRSFWSWGC